MARPKKNKRPKKERGLERIEDLTEEELAAIHSMLNWRGLVSHSIGYFFDPFSVAWKGWTFRRRRGGWDETLECETTYPRNMDMEVKAFEYGYKAVFDGDIE